MILCRWKNFTVYFYPYVIMKAKTHLQIKSPVISMRIYRNMYEGVGKKRKINKWR